MKYQKIYYSTDFIGQGNIILSHAELIYVPNKEGWAALDGTIITNKKDAIKYTNKVNDLIIANEKTNEK